MWGEWDENVSDLKWKAGKRERERDKSWKEMGHLENVSENGGLVRG